VSANGRLGDSEYAELVGRIRATVDATVPPGSSVLVVSKGDAALVEHSGMAAAHFPQADNGGYAGHHPRDSAAAIAQVEDLRRRGAEYLVVPTTARWWLDYYGEFAAHLANHGEVVVDQSDSCLIYRLGRKAAAEAPLLDRPRASVTQIRDYLERLIAAESRLVVLEPEDGIASALAPIRAAGLRLGDLDFDPSLRSLRRLAAGGAEFLVVPRGADDWLDEHDDVAAEIELTYRKVADQRHLCRVFALDHPRGEQ
jgi:hypothetical protein